MEKTLRQLSEITVPASLTLADLERVLTWPTWGYFRELVESTRSHEAGLAAGAAMFRSVEAHRKDLPEEPYNEYGKKLLSFILEMLEKLGRWDDYLQAWDRFRNDSDFYITYSTRSLDHHGIRMAPFVLGASPDGLRVHFLWLTARQKEFMEEKVKEAWAGGNLHHLSSRPHRELTPRELEDRVDWLIRKTVSWSERTAPRASVRRPQPQRVPVSTLWLTLGLLAWAVVGTVMVWALSLLPPEGGLPPSSAAVGTRNASPHPTPGITRVGRAQSARLWQDLNLTPGVQKWTCSGDLCTVMLDPVIWASMDSDGRRDLTASLGVALAYGRGALRTEIRSASTNDRLAVYSTRFDTVEIH